MEIATVRQVQLRELLAVQRLGLVLRCGEEFLDREIGWVHSTELPDPSPYLGGRELILTGGLWDRRSGDPERFVSALAGAGVHALGYGVPAPDASAREELVEACRHHDVPLFEVPYELPFMEVSRVFVGETQRCSEEALRRAVHGHEALSDALAQGLGLPGLLRSLSAQVEQDVWLIQGPRRALAARSVLDPIAVSTIWDQARACRAFPGKARVADTRVTLFLVDDPSGRPAYLVHPEPEETPAQETVQTILRSIRYFRLELVRLHEHTTRERHRARELLAMIESGTADRVELERTLRPLTRSSGPAATLVLAHAPRSDPDVEAMAELFARVVTDHGLAAAVSASPRETVGIVTGEADEVLLRTVAGELLRCAPSGFVNSGLAAGLGSTVTDLTELTTALTQARRAAHYARLVTTGPRVASHGDLGSRRILLSLAPDLRESFCSLVLGPLVGHDRLRGSDLYGTLRVFLMSGGQWQRSADALNIHVNTLRYRLGQIEEISGRSLQSMADRVDLYLALELQAGTMDDPVEAHDLR